MSFGGGYNGGRTRMGCKVYLNLYDLSPANEYLYPVGLGMYHSGVEVLGSEYSFGSGSGIFDVTPQQANSMAEQQQGIKFRGRYEMGVFEGGQSELRLILDDLRDHFSGADYHLIKKNCNHFSNAFLQRLIGKPLPPYINRITEIALCCSCLLPKQLLEDSPVGEGGGSSSSGSSLPSNTNSHIMSRGGSSSSAAFSGKGARLGGTTATNNSEPKQSSNTESVGLLSAFVGSITGTTANSSSSSSHTASSTSSSSQPDLIDRRERARKAALARLESQNRKSDQNEQDAQNNSKND